MYPPLWGKYYWNVLHLIAYTYDPADHEKILMLISNLISTLPCRYCSHHALIYVYHHPMDLSSREALIIWMNNFHNEVNRRTNKAEFTLEESIAATQSLLRINETKTLIYSKKPNNLHIILPIVILTLVTLSFIFIKNVNLRGTVWDDPPIG